MAYFGSANDWMGGGGGNPRPPKPKFTVTVCELPSCAAADFADAKKNITPEMDKDGVPLFRLEIGKRYEVVIKYDAEAVDKHALSEATEANAQVLCHSLVLGKWGDFAVATLHSSASDIATEGGTERRVLSDHNWQMVGDFDRHHPQKRSLVCARGAGDISLCLGTDLAAPSPSGGTQMISSAPYKIAHFAIA